RYINSLWQECLCFGTCLGPLPVRHPLVLHGSELPARDVSSARDCTTEDAVKAISERQYVWRL
ncbi:MAG: hypothetical protein ACPIOQ_70700, partial [Promethearchaeia archaeon]